MTNDSKPHIILIPGAGHRADAYSLVAPLLEAAGHPTTALTLPSAGGEPPVTSLEPDIAHIRNHVISVLDIDRDVVVVMHSYGGVPGSSALFGLSRSERQRQGFSHGVIALIYLCARMLPVGQSAYSAGGGHEGRGGSLKVEVDGNYVRHLDPIWAFYNDIPADLAMAYASRLTHHSLAALKAPVTYAAHQHIPTTYLVCRHDNMIPYKHQLQMIRDAGCQIATVECSGGHSPFYSQPKLTVSVIRHAAGDDLAN